MTLSGQLPEAAKAQRIEKKRSKGKDEQTPRHTRGSVVQTFPSWPRPAFLFFAFTTSVLYTLTLAILTLYVVLDVCHAARCRNGSRGGVTAGRW